MPDPKNEYERLQRERAGLDEQMLALVHRRAEMSKKIGALRHRLKETAASESLREVLGALAQTPAGPMPVEASQAVFREIVSACQQIEEPLRVAFVGPEGSDGHQASRKAFGLSTVAVAADSVAAVFDEVERGRAAVGIVPVELSTEGVISTTLDRLVESALKINGEVELPIAHHLMNRTGNPKDVEKIYAHATVLARCRRYIEKHFPNTPVIDVRSTAQAAKFAADDHGAACIATDLALELYGLEIAQSSLDDEPDTKIRFLFVGPADSPPTGRDQTALVFAIKDHPGALYESLKPFADRKMNLLRIESRPSKNPLWDYVFFVDLDGHVTERQVTSAIEEVKRSTKFLRVLGSYPKR